MRKERFLISVLWLNAMTLLASWFFNIAFGFNIFQRAHWRYLSELQITGVVDKWFYIAIAGFAVLVIAGLYFLIVPWHRKITMQKQSADVTYQAINKKNQNIVQENKSPEIPLSTRPPKLNLNNVFIPTRQENIEIPTMSSESESAVQSEKIGIIKNLLAQVGFIIKDSPTIDGVHLDFYAIGSDEALVVGLFAGDGGEITAAEGGNSMWRANGRSFKSPVWALSGVVQKLQALFLEVIDAELKINILPFVLVDGAIANKDSVQTIWDALGLKVFDNIDTFSNFLGEHSPRKLDANEQGDFDAFSDFIDTVSGHFNNGGA
jgi:hypothetical protein